MSVLEIEKAVFKLPLQEKQDLSSWLLELLEEEEDVAAVHAARKEGGKSILWEQIKEEIHWDEL